MSIEFTLPSTITYEGLQCTDYRNYDVITLDNDETHLFDDAIHIKHHKDIGLIEIGVHCPYFPISLKEDEAEFLSAKTKIIGAGFKDSLFSKSLTYNNMLTANTNRICFSVIILFNEKTNEIVNMYAMRTLLCVKTNMEFSQFDALLNNEQKDNEFYDICYSMKHSLQQLIGSYVDGDGRPIEVKDASDIIGYLGSYVGTSVGQYLYSYYREYSICRFVYYHVDTED